MSAAALQNERDRLLVELHECKRLLESTRADRDRLHGVLGILSYRVCKYHNSVRLVAGAIARELAKEDRKYWGGYDAESLSRVAEFRPRLPIPVDAP